MLDRKPFDRIRTALDDELDPESKINHRLPEPIANRLIGFLSLFEVYYHPDTPAPARSALRSEVSALGDDIIPLKDRYRSDAWLKFYEWHKSVAFDGAHIDSTAVNVAVENLAKAEKQLEILEREREMLYLRIEELESAVQRESALSESDIENISAALNDAKNFISIRLLSGNKFASDNNLEIDANSVFDLGKAMAPIGETLARHLDKLLLALEDASKHAAIEVSQNLKDASQAVWRGGNILARKLADPSGEQPWRQSYFDRKEPYLEVKGGDPKEKPEPYSHPINALEYANYISPFVRDNLAALNINLTGLSDYDRYGLSLFLAGALDAYVSNQDIGADERLIVLKICVVDLGVKENQALLFAQTYEEHILRNFRYKQIYQDGRNALRAYSQGVASSARVLKISLENWAKPDQTIHPTGVITVLFTDIEGTMEMVQTLGDAGAQEVIRIHNRIVRAALSHNYGREVKHTGDGILASFATATDGANAAIQIQKETASHTAQNPKFPFHLKIGINSGEPIQEDNDLFGSAIQLAARTVDKAVADQILVSETVRDNCGDKNFNFQNKGGFPMKGFDEDVTLFELVWWED